MSIEADLPNVFVLAITNEHKDVFARVANRVISQHELIVAAIGYWLNTLRLEAMGRHPDLDDADVWDAIHEVLCSLPDWQKQNLAALHAQTVTEALYSECDQLSHEVMQMGEDLSGILKTIGYAAEGISHICRVAGDDCALYVSCHFNWSNNERVSGF